MPGKITFQFDDGLISHYEKAFPVFKKYKLTGCLALPSNGGAIGYEKALEMQNDGWEILCHSATHVKMNEPLDEEIAKREIVESKKTLELNGFNVRQFVTPCSVMDKSLFPIVASVYDAAFTVYTNSKVEPVEKLVIERPCNRFELHRASLSSKTQSELFSFVDYVAQNDEWLIFYDHDIGKGDNITVEGLDELLGYIVKKGVAVMTSSEALDSEPCRTRILREGWNGTDCYVHTRVASDGANRIIITSQLMKTAGCDYFDTLQISRSDDCGRTWTPFEKIPSCEPVFYEKSKMVFSDMTPTYHKKTGKFIVTGHIVHYALDEVVPYKMYYLKTPYAVFDEKTGTFGEVKFVSFPEGYLDCGSGCSQIYETENGEILMPIRYREVVDGERKKATAFVARCSFDGETITFIERGNILDVPDEERGIGESSLIFSGGKYFLTIRGSAHGYVSKSDDGLHFTQPIIWCWDDGEIVPTYCTQSHIFTLNDKLYLVYTRKNGHNDRVFRHRAPLYVTEVDRENLRLIRSKEFVAVPERGARLGNFGVCQKSESEALVTVTEWMQPIGCEQYGSNNALWLTDIHA